MIQRHLYVHYSKDHYKVVNIYRHNCTLTTGNLNILKCPFADKHDPSIWKKTWNLHSEVGYYIYSWNGMRKKTIQFLIV